MHFFATILGNAVQSSAIRVLISLVYLMGSLNSFSPIGDVFRCQALLQSDSLYQLSLDIPAVLFDSAVSSLRAWRRFLSFCHLSEEILWLMEWRYCQMCHLH